MAVAKNIFSDTRRAKFARDVSHEEAKQARHRVRTRFDGGYRAVCSCTWVGPARDDHSAAEHDGAAHGEGSRGLA
jgi:hypothetical protein